MNLVEKIVLAIKHKGIRMMQQQQLLLLQQQQQLIQQHPQQPQSGKLSSLLCDTYSE